MEQSGIVELLFLYAYSDMRNAVLYYEFCRRILNIVCHQCLKTLHFGILKFSINFVSAELKAGDVVWAPYRRFPEWPALVGFVIILVLTK